MAQPIRKSEPSKQKLTDNELYMLHICSMIEICVDNNLNHFPVEGKPVNKTDFLHAFNQHWEALKKEKTIAKSCLTKVAEVAAKSGMTSILLDVQNINPSILPPPLKLKTRKTVEHKTNPAKELKTLLQEIPLNQEHCFQFLKRADHFSEPEKFQLIIPILYLQSLLYPNKLKNWE